MTPLAHLTVRSLPPPSSRLLHSIAAAGFTNAEHYHQSRPSYGNRSIDAVLDLLPPTLDGAPKILELGAGTGLFTAPFLARLAAKHPHFDYEINEPLALSDSLEPLLKLYGDNVRMSTEPVKQKPLAKEPHMYDLVICAQSFHWFVPYPMAYKLIRDTLKPGGALALVWNERNTAVPWIAALEREIIEPLYEMNDPRQQSGKWGEAFEHFLGNYYGNLHNVKFEGVDGFEQSGGHDMVVQRVLSLSVVNCLAPAEKDEVAARTREFLSSREDTKDRESDLTLDYYTDVYYTRTIG